MLIHVTIGLLISAQRTLLNICGLHSASLDNKNNFIKKSQDSKIICKKLCVLIE